MLSIIGHLGVHMQTLDLLLDYLCSPEKYLVTYLVLLRDISIYIFSMVKLEVILKYLHSASLKYSMSKSVFCIDKIEYLGFYITQDRIKPINNKVWVILNLESLKNIKEVQCMLSMV